MCLWLLTACLGLLPTNPQSPIVIIQGVPTAILQPTTAATTRAPNATMSPPTMPPTGMTMPTAMTAPTAAPTMMTPRPTSPGNTVYTSSPGIFNSSTSITQSLTTIMPSSPTNSNPTQPNTYIIATNVTVIICANSDVICVANPDDNTTGQLPIDPRLGTTQTPSADFRVPQINGYSSQNPSYGMAVKFPREKRSIDKLRKPQTWPGYNSFYDFYYKKHSIQKRQSCRCVPSGTCINPSYGAGMIDIRIVTPTAMPCPAGQEYCCGSTTNILACGTLQTVPAVSVTPASGQANFGEYPWQAIILTKQNDYIAGGVLIDQLNVITVTHRLSGYIVAGTAPNLKVRLGEWDAAGTYEPIPFQEYTISKVFSHPSYNPNTLQYDITVLRLSSSVPITPMVGSVTSINRACLPPSSTTTYNGQRCWVAGWGKDMFGAQGQYQQILKEVDVPIIAPDTCVTQLRVARLGPTFVLDTTSFICAGGESNKDSCTGDGGSGLVCPVNGQWVVVGLVSWGLGCANVNVPAAYVNIAALLPWIQQQVAAA